jgi:hypothetical protein
MQQNTLDHWIKQRFVYQYNIYTNRLPAGHIPKHLMVETRKVKVRSNWKYRLTFNRENNYEASLARFEQEQISHEVKVSRKSNWFVYFLDPHKSSFTYTTLWWGLKGGTVTSLALITPFHTGLHYITSVISNLHLI